MRKEIIPKNGIQNSVLNYKRSVEKIKQGGHRKTLQKPLAGSKQVTTQEFYKPKPLLYHFYNQGATINEKMMNMIIEIHLITSRCNLNLSCRF